MMRMSPKRVRECGGVQTEVDHHTLNSVEAVFTRNPAQADLLTTHLVRELLELVLIIIEGREVSSHLFL